MPAFIAPFPVIEYRALERIEEQRRVALFTSGPAWEATGGALRLPISWRAEPGDASQQLFELLAADLPGDAEVIYAVGGGLPADAAKYAGMRRSLPVVAVPTALSVDAHLTPASGIRRDGCVFYIPSPPPERVWCDLELLAAAPTWVRAAGLCDVLSIATGLWDWRLAEQRNQNSREQHYIAYAAAIAESLLAEALGIADAAGQGKPEGLIRLMELLALEVQLCNLIGHSRPEEGSEHAFAYSIENSTGKGLPHGDLVGPGIMALAAAQGQDVAPLMAALQASGARLDRVSLADAESTLRDLPEYVLRHALPYGKAHELDDQAIERAMNALQLARGSD